MPRTTSMSGDWRRLATTASRGPGGALSTLASAPPAYGGVMRRVIALALLLALVGVSGQWSVAKADGVCLTRDEAITVVAHKADVEHGGRVNKWRVWAIMDRESGGWHCWPNGRVKVSATADHGLLQLNPNGVFRNCRVNPYCNVPSMIDDPGLQVDIMLNYYELYGDLCPWNPAGNYMPGCGYR